MSIYIVDITHAEYMERTNEEVFMSFSGITSSILENFRLEQKINNAKTYNKIVRKLKKIHQILSLVINIKCRIMAYGDIYFSEGR